MSAGEFFQLDATEIGLLEKRWSDLIGQYAATREEIDHAFRLLAKKYNGRGRVYHNLSHVKALLESSRWMAEKIADRNALAFAIWFHDAVYNTRRNDNEEKSAELAESVLQRAQVPADVIDRVQQMILATKEHRVENDGDDKKMFLDLDLAILGAPPAIYREYAKAIRREYRWVPSFMYRRGRRQILEGFLKRERLYFTEELAARFESQARQNVEQEIKELSVKLK